MPADLQIDVFTTEDSGQYTGHPLNGNMVADSVPLMLRADDGQRDYRWFIGCEHIVAIRIAQP